MLARVGIEHTGYEPHLDVNHKDEGREVGQRYAERFNGSCPRAVPYLQGYDCARQVPTVQ